MTTTITNRKLNLCNIKIDYLLSNWYSFCYQKHYLYRMSDNKISEPQYHSFYERKFPEDLEIVSLDEKLYTSKS